MVRRGERRERAREILNGYKRKGNESRENETVEGRKGEIHVEEECARK